MVTTTGKSAQIVSKFKPRCPIVALTRYAPIARQLHMFRGIVPIIYEGAILFITMFSIYSYKIGVLKSSWTTDLLHNVFQSSLSEKFIPILLSELDLVNFSKLVHTNLFLEMS